MSDHSEMKLGALPMAQRKRVTLFRLADYVSLSTLPAPAARTNWSSTVREFPMDGNDKIGDCVVAAAAHHDQVISKVAGREYNAAERSVERIYYHLTGGPDVGLDPAVMFSYWQKTGLTTKHRLLAYARVDFNDEELLAVAGDLFAGYQAAVNLPITAQRQDIWDTVALNGNGSPGSWGGHMIYVPDRNDGAPYTCITWGGKKFLTRRFLVDYGELALVAIGSEWRTKTIRGFDLDHLLADLEKVRAAN